MSSFKKLKEINVSSNVEKKNGLSYLSWAYAWGYVLEHYPDSTYEIVTNENGLPYFIDENGAMCYTNVTIEGITRMMWLPVLDGANKPLKAEAYTYSTKYGDKSVEAINMFDVNKTLMRCLVKNLGMFGLGLNLYAGEDLPLDLSDVDSVKPTSNSKPTIANDKKATKEQVGAFIKLIQEAGISEQEAKKKYGNYILTTPFEAPLKKAYLEVKAIVDTKAKK